MEEPKNYRMPMPSKMGERGSTGGVSHAKASIARQGMHAGPMLKTGGMTLQPGPTNSPTMPSEADGFAPDEVISEHEPDAQSEQCEAPPIAAETEPAETIPTTAKPTSGGETDPIVAGENSPTGGLEEARYSPLTEQSHPVGFPADRRTKE